MTRSPTRHIALYGGAFDPPHNGHIATIALLLNSGVCSEVLVVPSGERPDKRYSASATDRFEMMRLAVSEAFPGSSKVGVSNAHVAGLMGYGTIDQIEYFSLANPGVKVSAVIGAELLRDIHTWKDAEKLRAVASFLVVERPGAEPRDFPSGWRCERVWAGYEAGVLVSSTTLRSMLAKGASCAGLMPETVIAYCGERGLYGCR